MEQGEKLALLDRLEQRYPDEGMRGLIRELRQRIERESDRPPHAPEPSRPE